VHKFGKIDEISSPFILDLDNRNTYLHTTPSFNLTFRSHIIIQKPKILLI